MSKAMNLYFNDDDRAKIEAIRKGYAARGMQFLDKKGNPSTSALLRQLIEEKSKELQNLKANA